MQRIIQTALENFSFLKDARGFANPIVKTDTLVSKVTYLRNDIGIEIELDFRDLDVFTLIVKVSNGELIKGYYVSNVGERIRIHLEEVISPKKIEKQQKIKTEEEFKNKISYQAELLDKNFNYIEMNKNEFF